jgi:hypothetical protein
MKVKTVGVAQVPGNPLQWFITVEFSTSVPEDNDELSDDPINRPPGVSIVQISQNEPVKVLPDFFSINGGLEIVTENSAGVTYDPPIEREVIDLAIVVVQNFEDFRPADLTEFNGAVNSEEWEGFDRGLARIINIGFQELTENGVTFFQRTVEIHTRPKQDNTDLYKWNDPPGNYIYPWQVIRVNEGIQQLDTEGVESELIFVKDGLQAVEPIGLTATGQAQNNSAVKTVKRYNVYPRKDFADLDIRLD